jgi:DNA-binding XRE family transcriptional regulator
MRATARLTLDEAAAKLDLSRSALSRMEKGETTMTVHLARTMMDVYDQYAQGLLEEVRQAREPGWWQRYSLANREYLAWEICATKVHQLAVSRIPELLQTEPYAEALLLTQTEQSRIWRQIHDELLALELRQARFNEQPPLELSTVITEAALRDRVGSPEVLAGQCTHLVRACGHPAVSIRVLPASATAQPRHSSGFTVLDFADPADRPQLYADYPGELKRDDKQCRVDLAREMFDGLCAASLSETDSVEFIASLVGEEAVAVT